MGIEENKTNALKFMRALVARDMKTCRELMCEDGTWWIPKHLTTSGLYPREDYFKLAEGTHEEGDKLEPMTMTVRDVTAEDDRVCIHWEGRAVLPSGLIYNNEYHNLIRMRDGKVLNGYEFLNSQEYIRCFGVGVDLEKIRP